MSIESLPCSTPFVLHSSSVRLMQSRCALRCEPVVAENNNSHRARHVLQGANCAAPCTVSALHCLQRQMHWTLPICTHSCVEPDKTQQCDHESERVGCTAQKLHKRYASYRGNNKELQPPACLEIQGLNQIIVCWWGWNPIFRLTSI